MKVLQKIKLVLIAVVIGFLSKDVSAQTCLYDAWVFPGTAVTSVGDVVSHNGSGTWRDYECKSLAWKHLEPNTANGLLYGWTEVASPCSTLTLTIPILDQTTYAGKYCRTAWANGDITDDGNTTITARGIVYGESSSPNIDDDNVIKDDYTLTGSWQNLMEDLDPSTLYYVRSYATNSEGTGYGAQTSFTTKADVDCADCELACDESDASLLNPATVPLTIALDDTVCITVNTTAPATVNVYGQLKVCNGAQISINGSLNLYSDYATEKGEIVYETCAEHFTITGSYKGYGNTITSGEDDVDDSQMISYCSTCNSGGSISQFVNTVAPTHLWGVGCRPTSTLLPVELGSFTVTKTESGNQFDWVTFSELNNSHFEPQVSLDGINWVSIGLVQGAGDSDEKNEYSFTDYAPQSALHYYRLKQLDYDGSESYSNIRIIKNNGSDHVAALIAFKNSNGKIEAQAAVKGVGQVSLLDARGRLIETMSFLSDSDQGTILEFTNVKPSEGVYFIRLKAGDIYLSQKLMVTK